MGLNHKKNANLQMVVLNLLITQISEGSWESLPTAAHKNLGVFHPGNILSPAFFSSVLRYIPGWENPHTRFVNTTKPSSLWAVHSLCISIPCNFLSYSYTPVHTGENLQH